MIPTGRGGAELALARAEIEDARTTPDPVGLEVSAPTSRFTWGLDPCFEGSAFDPDNPILVDIGAQLSAEYRFGGGFVAEGMVRVSVAGNFGDSQIVSAGVVLPDPPPVVRSDAALYHQQSDLYVERLSLAHFGRPAENLYSRLSFGYLERMFAGVSGEVLWQPADSRLGLGVELNHVWARDYDGGWRVGAFATLTDVSFENFGEDSFDKGIELEIPFAWFLGDSTRRSADVTLRPVSRDGGATRGAERATGAQFENRYWIDSSGFAWASEQWAGPELGHFRIERLYR